MADKPNPIQSQKFLSGVDYPARRDELVSHAESQGADENVLDYQRAMPTASTTGRAR